MLWFEDEFVSLLLSKKSDGDMYFTASTGANLHNRAQVRNQKVKQNRQKFFEQHNIDPKLLVNLDASHGNNIAVISKNNLGRGALDPNTQIEKTDGLITNIGNSYLMVTGADCFAVFFYDAKKKATGIAHCGWRGILGEIAPKMIKTFGNEFGSKPQDIRAWIGPGIKSCHFEVKSDVNRLFEKRYKNEIIKKEAKIYIDLPKIIALQLSAAGVKPENITEHPDCTYCEKEKWFSYRRDKENFGGCAGFIIHLK